MSRRNSIMISAERVTVEPSSPLKVIVRVVKPSEDDLIRLISEASSYLDWLRRRRDLKMVSAKKHSEEDPVSVIIDEDGHVIPKADIHNC